MSNGKKFVLIVAAIVIPFMLALGVILGILITSSGSDYTIKTEDTYSNVAMPTDNSVTSQPVNSSLLTTTEEQKDKKTFEIKDIESAKKAIIGKWEKTQNSDDPLMPATIEFFEDGTYQELLGDDTLKMIYDGSFSFSSFDRIKFYKKTLTFKYDTDEEDRDNKETTLVEDIEFINANLIRIFETYEGTKIQREYKRAS